MTQIGSFCFFFFPKKKKGPPFPVPVPPSYRRTTVAARAVLSFSMA